VVHSVAELHVDRSIGNLSLFLRTIVLGTKNLLDACCECGIDRLHQVSIDEVCGDLSLGRKDLIFTESSPLRPSSPYSASKAAADLLCLTYHRTYGLPITISRCSNNYDPYQFSE
jgi:dTDP-glucose 4,6-dehydratase